MAIRVLPKDVVDKIAAGEVIERPASVVKELIENALDAGATQVAIEVEDGGSRSIKITDDGHGIAASDLELAFASHATSKLGAAEDLLHIGSFGFRGEALASIGSISRARIRSLVRGSANGAQVECDGGRLQAVREMGLPAGTTVEVRDLFFNVPARRRFLRTRATELAHIVEVVTRFSLSQPQVAFTLRHDGKDVFSAPRAQSLAERIAHAHGVKFAQALVHKLARAEGLRLEAFLGPPDQARPRAPLQVLFVNGRQVRDRSVAGAARRAYAEVLPHGLQPTYFLFLDVDPAQVDVNVHPTKAEVRFRDGGQVFRLVLNAITDALHKADLAPRVAFAGGGDVTGASLVREVPPLPIQRALPWASSSIPAADPPRPSPIGAPAGRALRYLQLHRTYLALEVDEGMLLIDQHALHERVIYQRLRRSLGAGRLETQRFLVPEVVEVDPARLLAIEEAQTLIERLGVELRPVGERAVALSAAPAILSPVRPQALVHAIASRLLEERPDGRDDDFLDRTLFTMACHRAVRAGDELEPAEIEALLREADLEQHTHTCPHGRPTRIVVTIAELENLFKRRGF